MITLRIRESEKCTTSDYSIFASFPYNAYVVDVIKDLPQRYWNNNDKTWEVPVKKLNYLLDELSNFDIEIVSDNYDWAIEKKADAPINFKYKTKPFDHQIDGFNYGMNKDKWLLGDEQGLGKTKQVIDIAVAKKETRNYKHCLIICGVNGLKWNWYNEIHTHSDEDVRILGQKANGGVGGNKDKLADLQNVDELPYFIITNVESLRDEEVLNALVKLCKTKEIGMIAADEVHKMKNPTSQQGKGFLKLQTETMIAMTGTPLMNNPLDLYIIFKWLGYEEHTFYSFKNYHCEMGGYGNYQIMGYKHLDELQETLDDIMLRRLKDEVLDLPEKTYIDEFVEMTSKQAQIYKEIHMDVQANIDQIKKATNPLSEMIRLRQATGYTGILSSTIQESAKLDRMEELIDEALENNKKVVVFSNWTQITDVVYDRLVKKYRVGRITGQTNDDDRVKIVNAYQSGNIDVMIGTIGAMGTGLTLTAGSVEIFLDHPWNRALYDQAVDRCHRIGQKSNITIYNLLTKNTIDERIWELVCKKGKLADAIVDGQLNNMDRSDLVDYLLS